jgi:Domain of unknown function (DUF4389)
MESGTPGPPSPAPEAPPPPPTGALAQSDQVPQVRPGSGPPSAPYVVVTEFDRQEEYNRWLPIVKSLLLIPHWFVLLFIWIAAFFAVIGSWFAVLFTGKYPPGIHKFVTGAYRWTTRVYAYGFLMTDRYPPFSMDPDDDYPARIDIAYTEPIARWRPLVHWLLVIPYAIVASVLVWVAYIITFIAFFAILFTKNFPQGMFDFNVVALRWQNRSAAYQLWMTEKYPPWVWG